MNLLHFELLGCTVRVECAGAGALAWSRGSFGFAEVAAGSPDLSYRIHLDSGVDNWGLERDGKPVATAGSAAGIVGWLDQDLTVQLQRHRRDLYFLHSAVLVKGSQALILVAESGGGKSTTAWALTQLGLSYMSDELAPIEPGSLTVHPHPRGVQLKGEPPAPYSLPPGALVDQGRVCIPVEELEVETLSRPMPLAWVFFLRRDPGRRQPRLERCRPAEAATRLYSNALNVLAHPDEGLEIAMRMGGETACFNLYAGDLASTCELVVGALEARNETAT